MYREPTARECACDSQNDECLEIFNCHSSKSKTIFIFLDLVIRNFLRILLDVSMIMQIGDIKIEQIFIFLFAVYILMNIVK